MRWIFYEPISCVNRRFQERGHALGRAPTFLAFRRKSDGMLANAQNLPMRMLRKRVLGHFTSKQSREPAHSKDSRLAPMERNLD